MSEGYTLQFYKDKVNEDLEATLNLKHLFKFIKHIPFDVLKETVGEIINNNDDNKILVKTLYFEIRSIDKIIPKDIIQYIISFQGLNLDNTKCVNKQWNKLSNMNEKRECLKKIRCENNHGLDYDEGNNKTRIIKSKQKQLTKSEKDMGFEICPVSQVKDTYGYNQNMIHISKAKSGDRYFIYPGRYRIKNSLVLWKKNLSFIGIASSEEYSDVIEVAIDCDEDEPAISIKGCHLRISGCYIRSTGCAIYCDEDSSLSISKSCIAGVLSAAICTTDIIIV